VKKLVLIAIIFGLLAVLFGAFPAPSYASQSVTIQPSDEDSYVEEKDGDKNYGTENLMWVDSKKGQQNQRSLVSFDLSSIPSGSEIISATLSLRMKDAPSESRTLEAQRVSASWDESSITWNNQPGVSGTAVTTTTGTTSEVWLSWDVTTDVQAFVQYQTAANYGWRIKDQIEASPQDYKESFYTKEESSETLLRPKLDVTYEPGEPKVGTEIGAEYPITISPSAMTPQQEWTTITVPVQDPDTLADVNEVKVKLFYDSAGTNPDEAGFSAAVQTCAILTWTRGGAPWTIAPASTTWAINTAGCSKPLDSATQGDWVFSFKVGKVASHSPGTDNWDIYAKATDSISGIGEDYLRDKEMNWYGEITVNTAGVDWGTVGTGSGFTDDTTNRVTASVTYICNGNFNKQIKASSPWGSSPTVTLNPSGTPGAGEFSLKADDDLTLADAALVSTSYATFGTGTQTDESGVTEVNNGIWLKTGSSGITTGVSYDGTIYYGITQ